jgi:hypothetical protein
MQWALTHWHNARVHLVSKKVQKIFFEIPEHLRKEITQLTGARCPGSVKVNSSIEIGSKTIRFFANDREVCGYWF